MPRVSVGLRGELHRRGEGLPGDPLLVITGSAMHRIWVFITFLQEPLRNASEPMALGSAVFQRVNAPDIIMDLASRRS